MKAYNKFKGLIDKRDQNISDLTKSIEFNSKEIEDLKLSYQRAVDNGEHENAIAIKRKIAQIQDASTVLTDIVTSPGKSEELKNEANKAEAEALQEFKKHQAIYDENIKRLESIKSDFLSAVESALNEKKECYKMLGIVAELRPYTGSKAMVNFNKSELFTNEERRRFNEMLKSACDDLMFLNSTLRNDPIGINAGGHAVELKNELIPIKGYGGAITY